MRKAITIFAAAGREVLIFSFFALLAIANTWPLARHLEDLVSDLGDPLLNTWILDWVLHSLTRDPLNLFNAPMFAGAKFPLAFSENLLGIAALVLPFKLAGFSPVAIHSIAMLIGFSLGGYGASVLARTIGASLPAAMIAGVSYGLCPYFFGHLSHLQIVSAGWLPLLLASLYRLLRNADRAGVALFVAAFVMNGLTNIHWLLFGGFAAAVSAIVAFLVDPAFRDRLVVRRIATAFLLGGVLLLPILIPYKIVSSKYGMVRGWEHIAGTSAYLIDYFRAPESRLLATRSLEPESERQLAVGLLPLMLAAAAILLTRRREVPGEVASGALDVSPRRLRALDVAAVVLVVVGYLAAISRTGIEIETGGDVLFTLSNGSVPLFLAFLVVLYRYSLRMPERWGGAEGRRLGPMLLQARTWPVLTIAGLWIGIGFLGSLGAHAPLAGFIYRTLQPFQAIRVAARWSVLVSVGLIVFAAIGVDLLLAGRKGWRRFAIVGGLLLAALADTAERPRWQYLSHDPEPVYDWMAQAKVRGPVFELPMIGEGIPFRYLLAQTSHRVPLINGTSGFSPPSDEEMFRLYREKQFNDVFWSLLEARRPQLLVVHVDDLGDDERVVLDWIDRAVRDGQLVLLRRFDRGSKGDFVFAFPKMASDWEGLRSAEPDPSGASADVNWAKLFRDESIYSRLPIVRFESPSGDQEVFRRLVVRGWAASPNRTRRVDVLIDGRRLVLPASQQPRHDVSARYPWYPGDQHGFLLEIPKRPRGIPRKTDVQIRVTDGAGQVVHSDLRRILWH